MKRTTPACVAAAVSAAGSVLMFWQGPALPRSAATTLRWFALLMVLAIGAQAETASSAQERAQELKANIEEFELNLWPNLRQVDKPLYSLTLTVAPVAGEDRSNPFVRRVQITKEQAGKIIDHLLAAGYLNDDPHLAWEHQCPEGYMMQVAGFPSGSLHTHLGWDLAMLKRLDGLRKVLDGDAAKTMDFLLGRMSGRRQQWQKEKQQ